MGFSMLDAVMISRGCGLSYLGSVIGFPAASAAATVFVISLSSFLYAWGSETKLNSNVPFISSPPIFQSP